MLKKTGIELITEERRRQIEEEGFDANHDAEHYNGELAMAAICFAAPILIYQLEHESGGLLFVDPFPAAWDPTWDKRYECGDSDFESIPDPTTYTPEERINLLIKAGALIAAEIDRLQRACRVCGCTAMRACPGGCSWVDPLDDPEGRGDIYSACLDKMEGDSK
jgi:hypothetical protein